MRIKQFEPNDLQINKSNREVLAVASNDCIDRDGEVVLPSALRTKGINYAGRPILWEHDKALPSLGSILWLKAVGDTILCKYRISDKTEFAKEIFDLLTEDPPSLKFHSIGFEVYDESPPTPTELKARPDWVGARNVIRDMEVLELSVCNVPCNPEASVVLKSCSTATRKILGADWETKDCWKWETKAAKAFTHNSTLADKEPDWGSIDKTRLPKVAFARQEGNKSEWGYPHHWVKDGGELDEDGIYKTGTMYLHQGGLNAAWGAANGAHTGKRASPEVISHLEAHRKAVGQEEKAIAIPRPVFTRRVKTANELILKVLERHTADELIAKLKGRA